ncbi:serine/threonine-protein kinase 17A [Anabrus simplex]|uniref:serine/threonine-protein kinase 17A n=1 Tax=Anabrus simplex TaxID=316456 RepID=UPI0035A2B10A
MRFCRSDMSKPHFGDNIYLNTEHKGLLSVSDERLTNLIKKEPIRNIYHVEDTPFARGKFAAVRKCTHRDTGVEYAAKFIRKRRRAMDQKMDILHEVAVLVSASSCTRIVSLHEVYETSSDMALVLELASGGELQRVLDENEALDEGHAVHVMRQILDGLSFLHDHNIAHLDLKPQNLLLTADYPDCDIRLCDFGISRVIQDGVEVREIVGTPDYVAPEILSYEPISLATDIWSVGVLAYVLLTGCSPFGGDTKQETFCNISQCKLSFPEELFEGVSDCAKDFIRATLNTDPRLRLTVQECLVHPWLSTAIVELQCNPDTSIETCVSGSSPAKTFHHANGDGSLLSDSQNGNGNESSEDKDKDKVAEEEEEDLPLHKRPKNCLAGRRSSFPVASCLSCSQCGTQCCHHTTSHSSDLHISQHRHSSITNSPVKIMLDRGIIC